MKQLLVLLAGIFLFMVIYDKLMAQDYQLINPNRTSFFISNQGKAQAIRVDSIYSEGARTVYEFYKQWKLINAFNGECSTPDSAIWCGHRCKVDTNGVHEFMNGKGQAIFIHSHASLNDSWVFHQYANGLYLEAKISAVGIQSFLGLNDSVKTVSLQLKDSLGYTDDVMHNYVIIEFSKNYGLISSYNFTEENYYIEQYAIDGMLNPDMGNTYLKWRDIYDFDINDEFHYKEGSFMMGVSQSYGETVNRVIDKQVFFSGDSIIYTFQRSKYSETADYQTLTTTPDYTIDTTTTTYSATNDLNYLPDEAIVGSTGPSISYKWVNQQNNNMRRVLIPNNATLYYQDSCWHYIHGDPGSELSYMEGCGLKDHSSGDFNSSSHNTLVYYRKGTEEWGEQVSIRSFETKQKKGITAYPNPTRAGSIINLDINRHNAHQFTIYNCHGSELSKGKLDIGENEISSTRLAPGLYFIKIENDHHFETLKLILE